MTIDATTKEGQGTSATPIEATTQNHQVQGAMVKVLKKTAEIANICFMAIGETSEVRIPKCHNFYYLQNTIDMITDELQKVIGEYNKISNEKKNQEILLEESQVEVNLAQEELDEIKMRTNSI